MGGARQWLVAQRTTLLDLAPAALLVALGQIEVWTVRDPGNSRVSLALLALLMTVPLVWRRHAPVLATVPVALALVALGDTVSLTVFPMAAALLATFSAAAHADLAGALTSAALMAAALAGVVLVHDTTPGDALFVGSILAAGWAAGRAVRLRQQRAVALADRATVLEFERDATARAAVAEERVRIARELHDVVAHAISVIVVQARGGRRVLDADPQQARAAFDSIESSGQQALDEMRRLLGMLRQGDEELALAPQPSLRHLSALVERVSAAGLPVELEVVGRPTTLAPGIDLSAYRILQEALTNALKHAGPARARVTVRYRSDELQLEVADDGSGPDGDRPAGSGLVGMRERVALYGGSIQTDAGPGGGFAMRATLPLPRVGP